MAFLEIKNVRIKGIAAAVPERKEYNKDFPKLSEEQLAQYIKTVGVVERRCAIHDGSLCTSDLCFAAAEKLLQELGWAREEIGLSDFNPIDLDTYVWESDTEREWVSVFAAVGNFPLKPVNDEVEEGRYWTEKEIKAACGKGILTPNFENEYKRVGQALQALL